MALVVLAGAGTLIVVSLLLAPAIFYNHLNQAGVTADAVLAMHVDEGFATAIFVSTLVGVGIAAAVAAGMASLISRRISKPVSIAAAATTQLANGDFSARVPSPHMGPELDSLADAVNSLAERLEATEGIRIRLMADLAHELRTPLAAIDATVEAIADGVLPADEHTLATLTGNSRRLSRLVEDLAAVSRAEERAFHLSLRHTDLGEVARNATANAEARFAAKGVLLLVPDEDGPIVDVDPDRMIEVVGQLLDNALNASREGGTVSLVTAQAGAVATLEVSDAGSGFAPDQRELIFRRFYRSAGSRSPAGGSGIGLTIARSLVEAQGGTLTATSAGPGTGATFTVALPMWNG
jgi:signal transduction histidine kinase